MLKYITNLILMGDNMADISGVFLKMKNVRPLILLRQGPLTLTELAKQSDTTYLHIWKLINLLEATGLVTTTKNGRARTASLTERGEEVALTLEAAYRQLSK